MRVFILLIFLTITSISWCQQLSPHSQYMVNDFTINPAIAGTKMYNPMHISFRRQWVGIKEAPVTQFLSSHGYLGYNIGLGGHVYNESTGPTRRTGVSFSSAYHLTLKRISKRDQRTLSFGGSFSLNQYALDKDKLISYVPDDPTVLSAYSNQVLPDASFGIYYHNMERFYIGVSVLNLFQSKSDLTNIPNAINNFYVRNYYLTAGGIIEMHKRWDFMPSTLVQVIEAGVVQIDATAKFLRDEKYWMGVSYRHKDAVIPMIGINFHEMRFGYSYDITLSNIRNYSSGSHEITCTILLNRVGENFYKTDPGNYRIKRGRFKPQRMF